MLHGRIALAPLLCSWLGAAGCVHSIESDVAIAPAPLEDSEYGEALTKATQARTVFKDFETRYQLTATYLSPAFRTAFSRRLERVYRSGHVEFEEAATKAGFFVSLQAPEGERTDLTNPRHWTVQLAGKDTPVQPILLKKLSDKERWRAFFPSVTEWTTEYLVVFDVPAVDTNSPQLVQPTNMGITFANADAQVTLSW